MNIHTYTHIHVVYISPFTPNGALWTSLIQTGFGPTTCCMYAELIAICVPHGVYSCSTILAPGAPGRPAPREPAQRQLPTSATAANQSGALYFSGVTSFAYAVRHGVARCAGLRSGSCLPKRLLGSYIGRSYEGHLPA